MKTKSIKKEDINSIPTGVELYRAEQMIPSRAKPIITAANILVGWIILFAINKYYLIA